MKKKTLKKKTAKKKTAKKSESPFNMSLPLSRPLRGRFVPGDMFVFLWSVD